MLRALQSSRGRTALLVLFALSAFLMCTLPPHHSQIQTATQTGATATSGGHPGTAAFHADEAVSTSAAADRQTGPHPEGDEHPSPVCHVTSDHVMDAIKRFAPSAQGDLLALLGALVVVLAGAAHLDTRARARWRSTRPPGLLAGFPLLITLGVSRT
ncbi:hypothetical protein GCM10027174_43200 [Salinifilum aidingensis]